MGPWGLAGMEKPCRRVLEHILSAPTRPHSVKITCGSKAPGDKTKESKVPLAGDQAWLLLQKPRHDQGVGHTAGHWEQPLSPMWGSSRDAGKGPAFNPSGQISDVRDQSSWCAGEPGEWLLGSLGRREWAGRQVHQSRARKHSAACLSQGRRKGRQGRGWPALWSPPQGRQPRGRLVAVRSAGSGVPAGA